MALQLGDSGHEVELLQTQLTEAGLNPSVSGTFDEDTQQAVWDFQEMASVTPTGVADDATMTELSRWTSADAGAGGTPAPGTIAVVDENGAVLATGSATTVSRAGDVSDIGWTARQILEAGAGTISPWIPAAIDTANALGWTVACGYDSDVASILGATGGIGLYFGPGDVLGLYASIGADLGAIIGVGVAGCWTVVNGGPDKLAGECLAFEMSGGEFLTAGASALFNMDGTFLGIAAEAGVGFGLPLNSYVSYNSTRIMQF
jgi:hypothetical protein